MSFRCTEAILEDRRSSIQELDLHFYLCHKIFLKTVESFVAIDGLKVFHKSSFVFFIKIDFEKMKETRMFERNPLQFTSKACSGFVHLNLRSSSHLNLNGSYYCQVHGLR